MAPVEFEKKIKEKLEERRIDPSDKSWNRIASQLNAPVRQKPGFRPYAIAAALAVLFFSGLWIVRQTGIDQLDGDAIVEQDVMPVLEEDQPVQNSSEPVLASEDVEETVPETPDVRVTEEALAQADQGIEDTQFSSPEDMDPLINEKLLEVVEQVRLLEENKDSVTDAEVDLLLKQARKELLAETSFRNKNTVNHQALLTGVETEIDKSFRDQVFEKLKLGFVKVRTAVASRND